MRVCQLLKFAFISSVALSVQVPSLAADNGKNPNECVRAEIGAGKAQMKNKCDFKINVRWKDNATCRDWKCTGSIGPHASIAIPNFNFFIAFRVCRAPQFPSAESSTDYCR
jgi:hypothetical protein